MHHDPYSCASCLMSNTGCDAFGRQQVEGASKSKIRQAAWDCNFEVLFDSCCVLYDTPSSYFYPFLTERLSVLRIYLLLWCRWSLWWLCKPFLCGSRVCLLFTHMSSSVSLSRKTQLKNVHLVVIYSSLCSFILTTHFVIVVFWVFSLHLPVCTSMWRCTITILHVFSCVCVCGYLWVF